MRRNDPVREAAGGAASTRHQPRPWPWKPSRYAAGRWLAPPDFTPLTIVVVLVFGPVVLAGMAAARAVRFVSRRRPT